MMKKKKISIQLIRIIAMFMIIFDHILCKISFPLQSIIVQVANSGVFIFLLISGFLYGNKRIESWKKWFVKRFIRICIPLWVFMFIDFIVEAVLWNNFDIKYVFIYAFNLQGILGTNIGGMNLWFLTLIMICYFITPMLQWIREKHPSKNIGIAAVIATVILQIILAYTTDIGMVAGHTLSWCVIAVGMYVVGYFVGNAILADDIHRIKIIVMTVLAVITSSLVLVCNRIFDGQIIYDRIVIFYGMVILDLWICVAIYKLGEYLKSGWILRIINHLDSISYEFYIVHGLIIAAVTYNVLFKFGTIPYVLSTLVLSWIAAVVLHKVCELIQNITQEIT